MTSKTCLANSLVGIMISKDPLGDFINNSNIGIQKAAVLPVPVCAEPKISLPCNINGIDFS